MELPTELSSYVRVLKMASTPSFSEFSQIAKIAGAGIVVVGILGFLIAMFMSFLAGALGITTQGAIIAFGV